MEPLKVPMKGLITRHSYGYPYWIGADLQKISAFEIWFAQKFQETILKNRKSYHAFIFGSSLPVVLTGLRIRDVNCNAGP